MVNIIYTTGHEEYTFSISQAIVARRKENIYWYTIRLRRRNSAVGEDLGLEKHLPAAALHKMQKYGRRKQQLSNRWKLGGLKKKDAQTLST